LEFFIRLATKKNFHLVKLNNHKNDKICKYYIDSDYMDLMKMHYVNQEWRNKRLWTNECEKVLHTYTKIL